MTPPRTHCKHGHKLEGANVYMYRGRKACNACRARYRRVDMQLPVGPFRSWLLRYAARNDQTTRSAGRGDQPAALLRLSESAGLQPGALYNVVTRAGKQFVQRHLVDTVLTAHGGYHLYDLYPELRDDD